MPPIIEAHNLTRYFGEGEARVVAVDHVNVQIEEGDLVVITGDSGCGKTTLISLLGCILTPSEGEVWLDGEKVDFQAKEPLIPLPLGRKTTAFDRAVLRREKVGFVFQLFNLIPYLTALENVMLALHIAGVRGLPAEKRARELLAQVGLEKRMHHRPAQLSGGEKQRVSFARALANRPKVIFADEPTANLDSRQSENLMQLVRQLRAEHQATIVIVTHYLELQRDADHLIEMKDGKILSETRRQRQAV